MAKIKFLDDTGKMEVTYEDHEKALHEAGHAVIAEALGLQVTGISLERVAVRAKAGSKEWAMIALAGKRAQQMANDKCQWSELGAESELIPTMSPSDREMIDAYLEKFMDYERRDIEAALGFRVGRLLDENWPKVITKAKQLLNGELPVTKRAVKHKPLRMPKVSEYLGY